MERIIQKSIDLSSSRRADWFLNSKKKKSAPNATKSSKKIKTRNMQPCSAIQLI